MFRFLDGSLAIAELNYYRSFSILAEPSVVLPLMPFLIKEMRLAPESIELCEHDELYEREIKDILERMNATDALGREFGTTFSEVVFGPGGMCEYLLQKEMCSTAVDISLPSKDYLDIAPKSIIGLDGCRRIVEKVVNTR